MKNSRKKKDKNKKEEIRRNKLKNWKYLWDLLINFKRKEI